MFITFTGEWDGNEYETIDNVNNIWVESCKTVGDYHIRHRRPGGAMLSFKVTKEEK